MELVREIIVPTGNSYLLNLPDEMIGKQVEVIAFEIQKPIESEMRKGESKISEIREIFRNDLIDLSNFKFNRDEANNYDE